MRLFECREYIDVVGNMAKKSAISKYSLSNMGETVFSIYDKTAKVK